jgi:DNA-binding response OmpR family regulator
MHSDTVPYEIAQQLQHSFIDSSKENKTRKQNQNVPSKINSDIHKNRKVLIVEDEILVAENLKETIEDAGYVVADVVLTGEEAVKNFSQVDPDIVIMDVKLAGKLDGVNAANFIHKNFKQVPIIFLSAYSLDQFPQILQLPPDSYLYVRKPFDANDLPKSIEKILRKVNKKT